LNFGDGDNTLRVLGIVVAKNTEMHSLLMKPYNDIYEKLVKL
jgi:hypothetical protein